MSVLFGILLVSKSYQIKKFYSDHNKFVGLTRHTISAGGRAGPDELLTSRNIGTSTVFNLSTCGFVLVNDVTNANSNRGAKKLFFKITSLRTTQIFNHTSSIRTVREKILIGFRFSTSWPTVLRRIVQPHLRILIRCELRLECSPVNVVVGICRYWYYPM